MMTNVRGEAYRQASVNTASPGKLTLMLFDGAVKFMGKAEAAFEMSDGLERLEEIHNNITRAQAIIAELQYTIDTSVEGELPGTLFRIYTWVYEKLQDANVNKVVEPLQEAEMRVRILRDAWETMLMQNEGAGSVCGGLQMQA